MITIKHHHDGHGHWCTVQHSEFRTYRQSTYAMGWDKPRYPMPTLLGTVEHDVGGHASDRPWANPDIEPYMIVITSADDRFDPVFTWDEHNGIWDTDSPNHAYNF